MQYVQQAPTGYMLVPVPLGGNMAPAAAGNTFQVLAPQGMPMQSMQSYIPVQSPLQYLSMQQQQQQQQQQQYASTAQQHRPKPIVVAISQQAFQQQQQQSQQQQQYQTVAFSTSPQGQAVCLQPYPSASRLQALPAPHAAARCLSQHVTQQPGSTPILTLTKMASASSSASSSSPSPIASFPKDPAASSHQNAGRASNSNTRFFSGLVSCDKPIVKWCKRLRSCKCPYLQTSGACKYVHLDDFAQLMLKKKDNPSVKLPNVRVLLTRDASAMKYFLLKDLKRALTLGYCCPSECREMLARLNWDLDELEASGAVPHRVPKRLAKLLGETLLLPVVDKIIDSLHTDIDAPAKVFATYLGIEELVARVSNIKNVFPEEQNEDDDENLDLDDDDDLPPALSELYIDESEFDRSSSCEVTSSSE
ncbi:hypothetical protein DIPPA_06699 [Diplonema papillatum]|nr:hypothetical protein DIPPA_06699 [Diplonema papillatum]